MKSLLQNMIDDINKNEKKNKRMNKSIYCCLKSKEFKSLLPKCESVNLGKSKRYKININCILIPP